MGNTAGTPAAPERQQPERENEENKLPPGVFANTIVLPPTEGQPEDEEYFGPVDEDNRQHGVGTVLYADRDPGERSKFHGEWVHGKRHGYGVLIWRNGSRYEGHFIDDKLGGQGVLCWSVGLEYRGEWINNYAHGRGELRFPNGKRYYGEWAHGKRHGWGQLSFPPNDEKQRVEYIGGWADDLQSGEGVMKWSNNASYSGQWLAGKRHGYGVHTFPTGERYEGEWKEGIRHGQGRRHYPDGSIYEGGWCRDKKHGSSRMILPHGRIIHELWDNGTKLPVPVPQVPQTLLTLCIEAVASDHWRIHRIGCLPAEVRDKINHLRVYRTLQRRVGAHVP